MLKSFDKINNQDLVYSITDFTNFEKAVHVDVYSGINKGLSYNKISVEHKSKPVKVFYDEERVYLFCENNYVYILEGEKCKLLTKIKFAMPKKIEYAPSLKKTVVFDRDRVYFIGENIAYISVPNYDFGFYSKGRLYLVLEDKIYFNSAPKGYESILQGNLDGYIKVSEKYGKILYIADYDNGVEVITDRYRLRYEIGFDYTEFYLKTEDKLQDPVHKDTAVKVGGETIYFSDGKLYNLKGEKLFELNSETLVIGEARSYKNFYLLPVQNGEENFVLAYSVKDKKGYFLSLFGEFFGAYILNGVDVYGIGKKGATITETWVSKPIKLGDEKSVILKRVALIGTGAYEVIVAGKRSQVSFTTRTKKSIRSTVRSKEFTITLTGKNFSVSEIKLYYVK